MTTVAFLGTGTMGLPMARNLAKAGHQVRAWNRTRAKAEPLADDGVTVVDTPAEAARGADVLVTMLLDTAATVDAARPALAELPHGALWLQMGTIGLAGVTEVAGLVDGVELVDAPVLGTKAPAEGGNLTVLAAGKQAVRAQADPLVDAVGSRTMWISDDAARGDGTRVKLAVNNWVLALTNAVGESLALSEALGVDPQRFLEALDGSPTGSPYAQIKGKAILNNDFTPSFGLDGAHKDATLINEAAGDLKLDLAQAAKERLRRASEAGHGDDDMAAAYFASFDQR